MTDEEACEGRDNKRGEWRRGDKAAGGRGRRTGGRMKKKKRKRRSKVGVW